MSATDVLYFIAVMVIGFIAIYVTLCSIITVCLYAFIHIKDLKPDETIRFSEEDIGEQEYYVVYSYYSKLHQCQTYLLLTRHILWRKKAKQIAQKSPYVEGRIKFFCGPQWLLFESSSWEKGKFVTGNGNTIDI